MKKMNSQCSEHDYSIQTIITQHTIPTRVLVSLHKLKYQWNILICFKLNCWNDFLKELCCFHCRHNLFCIGSFYVYP